MTNYYYLKDLANTVLALANSSGSIVESYDYDAYGNVTIRNGSGNVIPASAYGNRFLFQGREYDYTTQLYHFRARWYDPETGRWLSNDPIGISGGLNLYAFCGNDPVNFVDPSGREGSISEKIKETVDNAIADSSMMDKLLGRAGENVCEESRYIDVALGTIDLKHVVSGLTTIPLVGWSIGGDMVEFRQLITDYDSSLNPDDILSNAIGGWAQGAHIRDSGLFLLGLGQPPRTEGDYVAEIILWLEPIGGLYERD